MDTKLYNAARDGDIQFVKLLQSSDIDQSSSLLLSQTYNENNILHIASKFNHASFIFQVIQLYPVLVHQQNSKGDTPLHIAARFGYLNVVQILINQSNSQESVTLGDIEEESGGKSLLMVVNLMSDTALHEALRNGREVVAEYLLNVNPVLACVVNSVGESPLYLAAESCCEGAMRKILELKVDFSFGGPHGQNPLHAARYCSETSIRLLLEKRPQLMAQPDQHGKTALHYATEAHLLKLTNLLLKMDGSLASLLDSEGFTPLLRASSMGWFQGFKAILKYCPESIEICVKKNGRNALHLLKMTCYTDGERFLKIPELQKLINERDNEGNTPLHLALENRNHLKVRLLLETSGVDVRAINRQGLSALDMSEQDWEESFKQRRMWHCLRKVKAPRGRRPNQSKVPSKGPPISVVNPMTDYIPIANNLSLVAILIVTVTFSAAFSIPGGYNSNLGENLGVAKKFAFRASIIADTFAMCSATTVVVFLTWAVMIGEHDLLRTLVLISSIVLKYSLFAMLVAFMSSLYAVIAPEALWVAILVCIMGSIVPFVVSQRVIIGSATGFVQTWHIK